MYQRFASLRNESEIPCLSIEGGGQEEADTGGEAGLLAATLGNFRATDSRAHRK
jgi:hypothetical protein